MQGWIPTLNWSRIANYSHCLNPHSSIGLLLVFVISIISITCVFGLWVADVGIEVPPDRGEISAPAFHRWPRGEPADVDRVMTGILLWLSLLRGRLSTFLWAVASLQWKCGMFRLDKKDRCTLSRWTQMILLGVPSQITVCRPALCTELPLRVHASCAPHIEKPWVLVGRQILYISLFLWMHECYKPSA